MTLQFNPGAYGQIYEQNENRNAQADQQKRQALSESLGSIVPSILQGQQQQGQDRMNQLMTALKLKEQGVNPGPSMDYLKTGQFPQEVAAGVPDYSSGAPSPQSAQAPGQKPICSEVHRVWKPFQK